MKSDEKKRDPFASLLAYALRQHGTEFTHRWADDVEGLTAFRQKRKTVLDQELAKLRKGSAGAVGKADPRVELSDTIKPLVGYVRDYHAEYQKSGEEELSRQTVKNLVLGTEAMASTRQKLIKGRGNVDSANPLFPEAAFRTGVAYSRFSADVMENAAVAETVRAGNCDFHAAVNLGYVASRLDKDTIAAKVSNTGAHHTFAELRGPQGETSVGPRDVIVDSWTAGPTAVLRQDSRYAVHQSASRLATHPGSHTDTTLTFATGLFAEADRQKHLRTLQPLGPQVDLAAQNPANRLPQPAQWAESHIADPTPLDKRRQTFQAGSDFTKAIQTVHAARQLGASVGGATKIASTEFPSATRLESAKPRN